MALNWCSKRSGPTRLMSTFQRLLALGISTGLSVANGVPTLSNSAEGLVLSHRTWHGLRDDLARLAG